MHQQKLLAPTQATTVVAAEGSDRLSRVYASLRDWMSVGKRYWQGRRKIYLTMNAKRLAKLIRALEKQGFYLGP